MTSGLNLMWFALLAGLVGAGLMLRGLMGRRTGDEPRCRRCRYNLTGLEHTRCPECGTDLSAKGVMRGLRSARKGLVLAGALPLAGCLTLGGFRTYSWAVHRNWYPQLPLGWVLRDAERGNLSALYELNARIVRKQAPDHEAKRIADAGLKQHANMPATPPTMLALMCWEVILGDADARGLLSDPQRQQYYAQLVVPRLLARAVIRQEDPVVLCLAFQDRSLGSKPSFGFEFQLDGVTIGGRPLPVMWMRDWPVFANGAVPSQELRQGPFALEPRHLPPDEGRENLWPSGKQTVELDGRLLIRAQQQQQHAHPLPTPTFKIRAEVDVRPAGAADPVEVVDDPDALREMSEFFVGEHFAAVRTGPGSLRLTWHLYRSGRPLKPLPDTPWSIEAILDAGLEPQRAATILAGPGGTSMDASFRVACPENPRVRLLLRPDADIARRTLDIFKVPRGQIDLGEIDVICEQEDRERAR